MPNGHSSPPKWLDNILAGYKISSAHGAVGVYDAATGYMLVRDIVCDGADVTLVLTRDRKEISENYDYLIPNYTSAKAADQLQPMKLKALPLTTGKGVKIGDLMEDVREKLGPPTKIEKPEQFTSYVYTYVTGHAEDDKEYTEAYTFKAGKLIEIIFSRDPARDE
jgi:hypothetical protein